jgi:predicted RNA-binding Zn ribbon-like protein
MQFDSHIARLLDVGTAAVNALTPGLDGGRPVQVPDGTDLARAVEALVAGTGYAPRVDAVQATALRELAARLRQVYEAADPGDLPHAAALVNGLLDDTRPQPRLDHVDGAFHLHFHGPDSGFSAGWAAGLVAGLAVALSSDLGGRLGVCAATDCDRAFVDGSRNAGRRFCTTRCQSRVKAAAHRARTR